VGQKQNFEGRVFQKLKSKASLLIKANSKNTSSLKFLTFHPSLNNLKIPHQIYVVFPIGELTKNNMRKGNRIKKFKLESLRISQPQLLSSSPKARPGRQQRLQEVQPEEVTFKKLIFY
jgi:hypothetical protein